MEDSCQQKEAVFWESLPPVSFYRYRGFGGLRGLDRLRARRTPRTVKGARYLCVCAFVGRVGCEGSNLNHGQDTRVVRVGCEVRLCDPCVRVSRVPCVPDSPPWVAAKGTATTLAGNRPTNAKWRERKECKGGLADDVARIRWTWRTHTAPRARRCLSASRKIAARANACACESKTIIYRNLTRLQSLMSGRTDMPIRYQHQQRARQI